MTIKKLYINDRGFTLFETMVALVIFLIILGITMPLFANQRMSTINNEIETGSVTVSQRILDELRQTDVSTLPSSGTIATLPSGTSIASISEMGKTYGATITYCANTSYCNANARHITVRVSHGQKTYTVETIYTRLQ